MALVSTVLSLGMLELALRARPTLLGDTFANGVLSKYSTGTGGIYYLDPVLRMPFMIPNLRTTMYFNRYVWTHETDGLGFRNRGGSPPAAVLLLGDSFVYGHGLEYEDTIGYLLAQLTGLKVANLARQGDCSVQEAYLLTEFLPVFHSRVVFYHFFENDIADVYSYLSDEEMREFIATPIGTIRYPERVPVAAALREHDRVSGRWTMTNWLRATLYVPYLYPWLKQAVRTAWVPPRPSPSAIDDENSLGWEYTKHAILYMHDVAARQGARLVIVAIPGEHAEHLADILRRLATRNGIVFLETPGLSRANRSLWLPRDDHFSPAGTRLVAEIERDYLRELPALPQVMSARSDGPGDRPALTAIRTARRLGAMTVAGHRSHLRRGNSARRRGLSSGA